MEISAETTTTWWENNGDRTHAKVELEIDLSVINATVQDLSARIAAFFERTALPAAIRSADPDFEAYLGNLKTNSRTRISGRWQSSTDGFHERITATVDLTTSAPVHPLQAFDHAREAISHAIADHVETCISMT